VQQGDVFGPIFFALGLDELLVAIRERMRNLPVDSTFIEQRVFVSELVLGTLVDGDHRIVDRTDFAQCILMYVTSLLQCV
jgi:hypothetical protein